MTLKAYSVAVTQRLSDNATINAVFENYDDMMAFVTTIINGCPKVSVTIKVLD